MLWCTCSFCDLETKRQNKQFILQGVQFVLNRSILIKSLNQPLATHTSTNPHEYDYMKA